MLLDLGTEPRTQPWAVAMTIATATAGLIVSPMLPSWTGSLPPVPQPIQRPILHHTISSDGISVPFGYARSASRSGGVAEGNSVTHLREISGLTADQLARLFSVSRRTVQNWVAGGTMAAQHEERLSVLLAKIAPLASSAAERRAALLSSNSGTSMFHRLTAEMRTPPVLQTQPASVRDRLGA
ncbi:helix-turn-helix domain-containing protein [Curtobacterium flaccumfaciens]|nr:helix-turn-helix domain-containing protein [Curtobacterium flaccumfaciens]